MTAAKTLLANPMRIKISFKKTESGAEVRSTEYGKHFSHIDGGTDQLANSKSHSTIVCSSGKRNLGVDSSDQKHNIKVSKKRGLPEEQECHRVKKRKMDRGVTHQCNVILKILMEHPAGWVFNVPVNPVALGIPDYFSIITKPMDLGTIKSKLNSNMYIGSDDFAADVRLTFSNAKLYNPPGNNVHKMAMELGHLFEDEWTSLGRKSNHDVSKLRVGIISGEQPKRFTAALQKCPKSSHSNVDSFATKPKSVEDSTFGKSHANPARVKVSKVDPMCKPKPLVRKTSEGTDALRRNPCGFVNAKPNARKCVTCGSNICRCASKGISVKSTSDETVSGGDHCTSSVDTFKLAKQAPTSHTTTSKSDGAADDSVSSLTEESVCPASQPTTSATDATYEEGWGTSIYDVELSPKRALRAAILKSRFADTILKAKQKTLLDQADKTDAAKLRHEKEKLERSQREEKARIEAQIRAAEAAIREKEEAELKRQRESAREAARAAVKEMTRTAEIELNLDIERELEVLCGCSLSLVYSRDRHPLEKLGLFIKEDVIDEDEIFNPAEEGELLL